MRRAERSRSRRAIGATPREGAPGAPASHALLRFGGGRSRLAYPAAVALAASLCGCSSWFTKGTPDNQPTLKTLAGKSLEVPPDNGIASSEDKAIAAYRQFLEAAPKSPWRAEAMRRVGDLEMDRADTRAASGDAGASGMPDYRAAVAQYHAYLQANPGDPGNDRVLYQLARASEQSGDLNGALRTLDRLVREYPATAYRAEAQFRRGELLFTLRDYVNAEAAYTTVLSAEAASPYRIRALYMQGWSRFKQSRLEDGLRSFFGVLDDKVGAAIDADDDGAKLSRADREMVDDTFRVTSLSLSQLQGAQSIPPFIDSPLRRGYSYLVYEQLAELYIKQDRVKDAADTFSAFVRLEPMHSQAPLMQARVIEIYAGGGFATLALEAKKGYVSRYAVDSEFRRVNAAAWDRAQPLVRTHLAELARHYHAAAQSGKQGADYEQAVRWYRAYLASFPGDADAAQNNFLLAELLFEDRRFAEAAAEYQKTAYDYARHAKAAEAGYAALLSYAEQDKRAAAAEQPALRRAAARSGVRFAESFPADARRAQVLADAAEKFYALADADAAAAAAGQVLALQPAATPAQRRVAWTVIAHTAFEGGHFDRAERAYAEVLALVPAQDAARPAVVERLAASVYKQGEQARAAGQARDAAMHFARVASVAPDSQVRATAQYDAAAVLIELKDWDAATRTLEDFRQRSPQHALAGEAGNKLAVVYLEQQRWPQAAAELERLAATTSDAATARAALWQAAELYDKAHADAQAAHAYAEYVKRFPQPLEPAIEARHRQAKVARAAGDRARELALMQQILQADQTGGDARSARTRYLGASAALVLAEPAFDAYRQVALVEPLARQLKAKKARLEDTLKAYAVAADYGVAEVSTAATYQVAALYQDFGRALLTSQRPAKLTKAQREQYDVMLEEQAFPFEEKAIALHEVNARRASEGLYDAWVQKSFAALRQLKPARYAKNERSEGVTDAIR